MWPYDNKPYTGASAKPTYPGSGMYAPRSQPAPAFATNQGSWGMNLDNPFGTGFPSTGSTFQPPTQKQTYVQSPGPAMGSTYEPPKSEDVLTASPFGAKTINTQTGDAFMGGTKVGTTALPASANQDVLTAPPKTETAKVDGMTYTRDYGAQPTFNPPAAAPAFQSNAFETKYGTLGNIQDYMNPYLDKIIERGNKNILASASARGLLGSTGTENQLGEWATGAQADAYNDAWSRFDKDRGYMTDVYLDGRNFDYRNMRDTDRWNYGLYGDQKADYDARMDSWLKQLTGIADTGKTATDDTSDIYMKMASEIAKLTGDAGQTQAIASMLKSQANRGLIGDGVSLLSLLFGGA
jgi:hypothetical protein